MSSIIVIVSSRSNLAKKFEKIKTSNEIILKLLGIFIFFNLLMKSFVFDIVYREPIYSQRCFAVSFIAVPMFEIIDLKLRLPALSPSLSLWTLAFPQNAPGFDDVGHNLLYSFSSIACFIFRNTLCILFSSVQALGLFQIFWIGQC